MPAKRPIVFQSTPLIASPWSSRPMMTISTAADQRNDRVIERAGDDEGVGDGKHRQRHPHRIETENNDATRSTDSCGALCHEVLPACIVRRNESRPARCRACRGGATYGRSSPSKSADHPYAARLYACRRSERAGPHHLYRRPGRHGAGRQDRRRLPRPGHAVLRESESRIGGRRRRLRACGQDHQLLHRHRANPGFREVRDRYIDTKAPPASTAVQVVKLAAPEFLFEIEAIAVVPEK